jgi:hypothetical protein
MHQTKVRSGERGRKVGCSRGEAYKRKKEGEREVEMRQSCGQNSMFGPALQPLTGSKGGGEEAGAAEVRAAVAGELEVLGYLHWYGCA